MEDPASKYFSSKVSKRDRALFEAGIAIGTLVHQFTGIPIKNVNDLAVLEDAMRRALLSQPFREDVIIKINVDLPRAESPYSYTTVKARNLDAKIVVNYHGCRVIARLRYIPELDYTLGYVEDIEED
ncbi:MAG: dihydroneopterin aldolase family protein [Desulfurococcaceae archaeon]